MLPLASGKEFPLPTAAVDAQAARLGRRPAAALTRPATEAGGPSES
ncbi:hypothetical protein ABZ557_04380 [Streptomyces sp. NPDC019645]